jgi:hypothetical protein
MSNDEKLFELATQWVCPNTRVATTPYEFGAINNLVRFGRAVLGAVEHRVHWTIATCAPEYHASLDEQGDRFCRMCGQPLSQ